MITFIRTVPIFVELGAEQLDQLAKAAEERMTQQHCGGDQ